MPDRINSFYRETPLNEIQDNEQINKLVETKGILEIELKKLDECCENVTNWISVRFEYFIIFSSLKFFRH